MKAWKSLLLGIMVVAMGCFCPSPLLAQDPGNEKPKPAARVLLPLPDINGNQQDSDQSGEALEPDHGPISGVQAGTLGTSALRHSYWAVGTQYGNTLQRNSVSTASTSGAGWTATNFASGNLSLLEAWSHSLAGVNYTGGGSFSQASGQGNAQFHQLSSAVEIDQRRWMVLLVEQFSYLPQTSLGFGGSTGLSVPGIGGALSAPLPGLQEVFAPGQGILSVTGPRYSSASAAQLSYGLSRRSAFTVAVVHGLLRFVNPGSNNNDSEALNVGYNYALTRKNSIGVMYRFMAYHFPGDPQALGDQQVQLVYARKIAGRLALNLGGGPDITNLRVPVGGTKQTISGGGGASLAYAFSRSSLRMSYFHGIGGGSGFFTGSRSDQVALDWSRPISRAWSSSLYSQFARNSSIVAIQGLSSPSFNSVLAGGGLNRPLARSARFAIGYQAQIQASSGLVCNPTACQTTGVAHQIQMSIQWNAPPQVIR